MASVRLHLPLHLAAKYHPDLAAIKLLARHQPQALLAEDNFGNTPLDIAIQVNENTAVVSLLRELTAARRATIALRTALLLCIKHCYVYVRRSKPHRTESVARHPARV